MATTAIVTKPGMFEQRECGCPMEPWKYPYKCAAHVWHREVMPDSRPRVGWYAENTCPFCGRVTPAGLACAHQETCPACGVTTCDSHGMACYKTQRICPVEYPQNNRKR